MKTVIEKIRAEIERLKNDAEASVRGTAITGDNNAGLINKGVEWTCNQLLSFIDTLGESEQPEDIVVIAKTFLDALSKTPYNNIPITDAQIIVKQLLLFFENPKEYNPNAILEQPDVDLEKEIESYFQALWPGTETAEQCNTDMHFTPLAIMRLAEHFYKLGGNGKCQ